MNKPLVSVIIRTCGRPQVLQIALRSVQEQSYRNIEVIVVEDGVNISESFIKQQFPNLNIHYHAIGTKQGRCCAGNIGLSLAKGKYMNFLDDDDILLPNHIETLIKALETFDCAAAYSIAEEHQIRQSSIDDNAFKVKRKIIRYKQPYNKLLLCYLNYIPIQSIMFQRTLFDLYGGFDDELDMLEDWDLWVRYSCHCDFKFVPVVTSVYYTPYKGKSKRKRESQMHQASDAVVRKHAQYQLLMNAEQINKEMDYILNVYNKKSILFYMQKIRNYLLYKDI